MIEVLINSKPHKLNEGLTIKELLREMSIQMEGTAIALNDSVVPRSKHGDVKVNQNDRIEIIRAVGGG